MSIIIRDMRRDGGIASIVKTNNGRCYCVDTANTFDVGPETMVFPYSLKKCAVTNWSDLYARRYGSMEMAYKKHMEIAENLEKYLYPKSRV